MPAHEGAWGEIRKWPLWWAWETHCVLLTRLSSSFTAVELIMTWFHSLSDTKVPQGSLGTPPAPTGFPKLISQQKWQRTKLGISSNKKGNFASRFFQWHIFVLAEVTLEKAVRGRFRAKAMVRSSKCLFLWCQRTLLHSPPKNTTAHYSDTGNPEVFSGD